MVLTWGAFHLTKNSEIFETGTIFNMVPVWVKLILINSGIHELIKMSLTQQLFLRHFAALVVFISHNINIASMF